MALIIASLVIVVDQVLKAYAFSLAKQLSALRDQILNMANKKDSNGLPLFGGLGSAANPFVDTPTGVVYQGNSGQQGASAVAIPYTADGQSTWMDVPTGNGTFTVSLGAGNTGKAFTDVGVVADPAAASVGGYNYTVNFSVVGGATTYTVTVTNANGAFGGTVTSTPVPVAFNLRTRRRAWA